MWLYIKFRVIIFTTFPNLKESYFEIFFVNVRSIISQNCLWKSLKPLLRFSAYLLYCSTTICGYLRHSRDREPFLDYVTWCKMMTNLTIEAKSKQSNCFYEWICFEQVILPYWGFFLLFLSFYFPIYYCSIFSNISHKPIWGQSWDSLC